MKISYGWVIVGTGMLMTCMGMGSMMSLSIFLDPMSQATGWSRTGISTAMTLDFLCMGLAAFIWGTLSDRYGTRIVVLLGGLILAAGLLAASQAESLWQFQLIFGIAVGVAAGSFYAPMTSVAIGWMSNHRSLAVALVSAGLSMGSMLLAPLVRVLINDHDWRFAMMTLGFMALGLVVPASFLVRQPPVVRQAPGAVPEDDGYSMTAAQAMRTPQFIAIALTHFACCAAHSGPIFHLVSNAIGRGVPALAAASAFGVMGLAALGGRVICGIAADRIGAKPTLVAGLMVQALGAFAFLFATSLGDFYSVGIIFGIAYGGVMPLYAILLREYFGQRIMGTTFGAVSMVASIGMSFGPWAGGFTYDTFSSYSWLYVGSFAAGLGAVAIALTFRPMPARSAPAMAAARTA